MGRFGNVSEGLGGYGRVWEVLEGLGKVWKVCDHLERFEGGLGGLGWEGLVGFGRV